MMNIHKFFRSGIVLGACLILMGCGQIAPTVPATPTIAATDAPAAVASATPVPTMIPTQAPTEIQSTPTLQVEPSATPGSLKVSAISKINCRKFPLDNSLIKGYLQKGQQADAFGRDASSSWLLVQVPTAKDNELCWVYATNLTLSGNISDLPVVSAVQSK
jgi:hypothetical protein